MQAHSVIMLNRRTATRNAAASLPSFVHSGRSMLCSPFLIVNFSVSPLGCSPPLDEGASWRSLSRALRGGCCWDPLVEAATPLLGGGRGLPVEEERISQWKVRSHTWPTFAPNRHHRGRQGRRRGKSRTGSVPSFVGVVSSHVGVDCASKSVSHLKVHAQRWIN